MAASYLQRFWTIDDDLLIAEKGSDEHRRHVHRYLRLCEDEFEAARQGILDYRYWQLWHSWLASGPMRSQLRADLEVVDAADERFAHIRACLSTDSPSHSWPQGTARSGRWHDLLPFVNCMWG